MADWSTYTDEELQTAAQEIDEERSKRISLVSIPEQINALNIGYLEANGVVEGEAWVQPTVASLAYPKDWRVSHKDKIWASTVVSNVWEPGVSGWHEVGGDDEWPDWVQPTGAHDAYPQGAKVTHVEKHWTSDIKDNVWVPGEYGWTEQS